LDDVKNWIVGTDGDIGGYSKASLELTTEGSGLFSGFLSRRLPKDNSNIQLSGYCAVKTRDHDAQLFGNRHWDTTAFRYLWLRVRGDERKYFVNVQTAGLVPTDLYQHRLYLKHPNAWETVIIPWRDFTLTNNGSIMKTQVVMFREKVRSIGFSVADRRHGPFRLEIDHIKQVNTATTDGDLDINVH